MQLTTLATLLFAAIAAAGPIALPDNVKVNIIPQRSTTNPLQMTDNTPERRP
jgi:hypothetical protein